jgi:hypothetical protein
MQEDLPTFFARPFLGSLAFCADHPRLQLFEGNKHSTTMQGVSDIFLKLFLGDGVGRYGQRYGCQSLSVCLIGQRNEGGEVSSCYQMELETEPEVLAEVIHGLGRREIRAGQLEDALAKRHGNDMRVSRELGR